ncbi:hypothetical protein SLNWT_0199 [Streptomyces albus]|uniref:Uncharacterized protein n=1 Tax=Streptomyces albus (strain ATCC 21838 / DSM 41398 / FERM P-419 / JCM 4703 / NBRC 107858) TaxID=1081613 RepID=A0A0B5EMI4_STRA4|nr:hypothetical protein SLNWT_0199 [Streptomyces albus]
MTIPFLFPLRVPLRIHPRIRDRDWDWDWDWDRDRGRNRFRIRDLFLLLRGLLPGPATVWCGCCCGAVAWWLWVGC